MGSVITMPVAIWHDRDALFTWATAPQQLRNYPDVAPNLKLVSHSNRRRLQEKATIAVSYLLLDLMRGGLRGLYIRLSPAHEPRRVQRFPFMMEKSDAGYLTALSFGWEDARDIICCYLGL